MVRNRLKHVSSEEEDDGVLRLAQALRVLRDRRDDRLNVGRRAADDAQDLRGRGLLLERLGEFAVARLELVEQPHVLDRDHRLVGEDLEQRDLLLGERADFGPADHDE
ncbi:MAG TPA: hypothetical protein VMJ70_02980, partial [Candidatus Sulfotelmatobacter sp.]|nr:hypothetical protein [Candidatus Sulfotelmatobacter sp.]